MIKETRELYSIVEESLDKDINNQKEKTQTLKGFIRKDNSGVFSLFDIDGKADEWAIKCIFSENAMKMYKEIMGVGQSNQVDYESWENSFIILKKYRFDYLLLVGSNSLHYRVVVYVEEFEIDSNYKSKTDEDLRNINSDSYIARKVEKAANNYLRRLVDQKVNNDQPVLFSAANFIHSSFARDSVTPTLPSSSSVYEILKSSKNAHDNNFLLKSEVSILNPYSYIHDVNVESHTVEKIKNFDYSDVFCANPTSLEKGKGNEFVVSEFEVRRLLDPNESPAFFPSTLKIGIKDTEENIKQFLMRKVKRHRPTKDFEKLPENMKNLIKRYGDVCANITQSVYKKYLDYKKFEDRFSSEVDTEMSK